MNLEEVQKNDIYNNGEKHISRDEVLQIIDEKNNLKEVGNSES